MIAKIVKQIQNDLISALHPDYVEDVFNYLPQTITQRKVICVVRRSKSTIGYEIGQKLPTIYRYDIDIIIIIGSTDYETAVTDLDLLDKKVERSISLNSNLSTLSINEEGHTETVSKYTIEGADYPDNYPPFDKNTQVGIIKVVVETEIHPN